MGPNFVCVHVAKATTVEDALASIDSVQKLGLDGVNIKADPNVMTPEVVECAHQKGLLAFVWVSKPPTELDVEAQWEAMYSSGVDAFTSNLPPEAIAWKNKFDIDR